MHRRDRAASAFLGIALAVAVLAIGGVPWWAQALVAALVAVALVPVLRSRRVLARSPLLVLLGIAAGITAFQLVPLPEGILAALGRTGVDLRADGTAIAEVDAWSSISLDPSGTLRGLVYFVTLLGVGVVSLRMAASDSGRLALMRMVAAVCAATAAITGLHEMVGATRLYGLYAPHEATPTILGPLLNSNHLGSLMAIGTVVAGSLAFHVRQSTASRTVWILTAIGCAVVLFSTTSRGAALAVLGGVGVAATVLIAQKLAPARGTSRERRRRFLTSTLPAAVVVICALFLVTYMGATSIVGQLEQTSLQEIHDPRSKFAAWQSSMTLVAESPWVGIGRGAVEPALTRVHPATAFVSVSHLENEYVQAVVEYGIPATSAMALAFAWLVFLAIRRWREGPLAAGALGALTALAVQSNVDFGVQLLGLAVPITMIAATLVHVPLVERSRGVVRRAWMIRTAHVAVLAGAIAVLALPMTTTVAEDHRTLAARPELDEIREAIARHPLDYYAYGVAAERLARGNDAKAVRLLNHALVLHPTHVGLHRLAARILVRSKRPEQAALEYATALRGMTNPEPLLAEIVASFPPADAARAIPTDYENVSVVVRALAGQKRSDVALLWLARVVELRPRDLRAAELMYDFAIGVGDLDRAEVAARRRVDIVPSLPARLALAKIVAKRNRHAEVKKVLGEVATWQGHGRKDEIAAAWILQCDAHIALEESTDAIRCLNLLEASGLVPAKERAGIAQKLDKLRKARIESP